MKNVYLRLLLADVNDEANIAIGLKVGITLSVGGQLISGYLVSRKEFHEQKQNEVLKKIVDVLEKTEQEHNGFIKEPEINEVNFLHLSDASYWYGSTRIPSQGGVNITVNIDSVDAYQMGTLFIGE